MFFRFSLLRMPSAVTVSADYDAFINLVSKCFSGVRCLPHYRYGETFNTAHMMKIQNDRVRLTTISAGMIRQVLADDSLVGRRPKSVGSCDLFSPLRRFRISNFIILRRAFPTKWLPPILGSTLHCKLLRRLGGLTTAACFHAHSVGPCILLTTVKSNNPFMVGATGIEPAIFRVSDGCFSTKLHARDWRLQWGLNPRPIP